MHNLLSPWPCLLSAGEPYGGLGGCVCGLGWRVRHRCSERSIGSAPSGCSGLAGWSFTCRLRPPVLPDLVPLALGTPECLGYYIYRIILILAGTVFASLGPLYTFA